MFLKEPIDIWVNLCLEDMLKLHRKPAGAQIHGQEEAHRVKCHYIR